MCMYKDDITVIKVTKSLVAIRYAHKQQNSLSDNVMLGGNSINVLLCFYGDAN